MASDKKRICNKCKCELEEMDTQFTYLDKKFRHKVPAAHSAVRSLSPRNWQRAKWPSWKKLWKKSSRTDSVK